MTVEGKLTELISKIGENITFKRFIIEKIDPSKERLFSYIHGEGRIGVMVKLASDKPETLVSPAASSLGKDLAMQIAASNPIAIDRGNNVEAIRDRFGKRKGNLLYPSANVGQARKSLAENRGRKTRQVFQGIDPVRAALY